MSQVSPHIFREYDVRGIVGEDITPELARQLGRAFASEVRRELDEEQPAVALGRDNRPSSDELRAGVAEGLVEAGARVIDVGLVPTPTLYFAVQHLEADAGVEVTASHNPAEYNGFKLLTREGPFYGGQIQAIRTRIEDDRYLSGDGSLEQRQVLPQYIEDVSGRFRLARPVKLVIDCGNGTGSLAAVPLLERVGAEVDPIFCTSDGRFPNHHPDPTVDRYLADLIDRVRSTDAELGIALDGDADRIGVVDEEGRVVRGDYLLLIYARDALSRAPGQKVIFDVKCSQALEEGIREAGGQPIMWKTGHSLIKEKMRESGARIAGEMSGHMFFGDEYYGYDDALYAACRLSEIVSRSDGPLSSLLEGIPTLASTPELRIECPEDRKFELVRRTVDRFQRDHDVIDVDGARIQFDGGWALVRASNTQPAIVLRFEAVDDARLKAIRETVEGWLREQGLDV